MKVGFFERLLVKYCEVMRKQRMQNLSAIEVYRVGQKECNTFQRYFLSPGKGYENETMTTSKQRFDKLYGISSINEFQTTSDCQHHV